VKQIQNRLAANLSLTKQALFNVESAIAALAPNEPLPGLLVNELSASLIPWRLWINSGTSPSILAGTTVRDALCSLADFKYMVDDITAKIESMNKLIVVFSTSKTLVDQSFPDVISGLSGDDKTSLNNMYKKYILPASYNYLRVTCGVSPYSVNKAYKDLYCEANLLLLLIAPDALVIPKTGIISYEDDFAVSKISFEFSVAYNTSYLGAALVNNPGLSGITWNSIVANNFPPFVNNSAIYDNVTGSLTMQTNSAVGLNSNAAFPTVGTAFFPGNAGISCSGTLIFDIIMGSAVSTAVLSSLSINVSLGGAFVSYPATLIQSSLVTASSRWNFRVQVSIPLTSGDILVRYYVLNYASDAISSWTMSIIPSISLFCSSGGVAVKSFDYYNRNGGLSNVTASTTFSQLFGQIKSISNVKVAKAFSLHLSSLAPHMPAIMDIFATIMKNQPKYNGYLGVADAYLFISSIVQLFHTSVTPTVAYNVFWNALRADFALLNTTFESDASYNTIP
jgi:hypothetical protein